MSSTSAGGTVTTTCARRDVEVGRADLDVIVVLRDRPHRRAQAHRVAELVGHAAGNRTRAAVDQVLLRAALRSRTAC